MKQGAQVTDLDDYFSELFNNEELDASMRSKAAFELGTLHGLRIARRYSLAFQLSSAGSIALKRYAKLSERFTNRA